MKVPISLNEPVGEAIAMSQTKMNHSSISKHRKAQAGLNILNGMGHGEALVKAGYAKATAKNGTANGLGVDRCLEAAAEAYPETLPSDLIQRTRRLFDRKTTQLLDSDALLKKTRPGEIARMLEVVERYHGERTPDHSHARSAGERLAFLAGLLEEYKRRGYDMAALVSGLKPASKTEGGGGDQQ